MGYSFSNIQIKNKGKALDTDRVLEVLTAGKNLRKAKTNEEADIIIAIHPGEENGWATVVSDLFDQNDQALTGYARSLSDAFQTEAMIIGCFDNDYLYLNLLDASKDADIWAASGHFPGGAPRRSNYNAWKAYVTDVSAFREIMRKDRVFAEECIEELQPILAISAKQSLQCVETAADEAEFICCRYMLEEDEKPDDPPRFELHRGRPDRYNISAENLISFLNCGGSSKGAAVFIGGEPFDTHKIEIEKVELQLNGPDGKWVFHTVEMEEIRYNNGLRGFYGVCPAVRIPKPIPKGLPLRKQRNMEYDRQIIVRFSLRKTDSQHGPYGYIQVGLIPLANKEGQAGIVLPFLIYRSADTEEI